ncbi:MAG: hypothetical protein M1831_000749 [Alyxoria varia]|nr:MAG: hypothetical protein M1831_000749 [Alyxoria varia]
MARQYKGADKPEPRHARLFTVDDEGTPTEFTDRVILVVSSHSHEAHLMKQNEGILQNWLKQQSTHARTFLISATPAEESVDYLNLVVPAIRHLWQWTWNSKVKQSVISKRRNLSAEQEAYAEQFNLQNVKKAGTAETWLRTEDDERYPHIKSVSSLSHISRLEGAVFTRLV